MSLGFDPVDVEELRQKDEVSIKLVEHAWMESEEREEELLASVKMREDQARLAEEGNLRAEGLAKEADQYSAQVKAEVTRHQVEPK